MQITEKQKQQLINLNDSRVNDILDLGLKVGEWYKVKDEYTDYLMCYQGNDKGYGFNTYKTWGIDYAMISDRWIKATKQEVEQELISEAKRRGFKEGVRFKSLSENGKIRTISEKIDINYYIDENFLTILTSKEEWDNVNGNQSNPTIFKDGQWAEIIDEKAELKQEIKELEVKLQELREKL